MDTKKITDFEIINQIQLHKITIICSKCENWLTTSIFLNNDGNNYCPDCVPVNNNQRNDALENVLANFRYPCKYINCDTIESYHTIQKHQEVCRHAFITCLFCKDKTLTDSIMAMHFLEKHREITKKIEIEEPTATLNMSLANKVNHVFILDYNIAIYIVFLKYTDNKVSFAVGKEFTDDVIHTFRMKCAHGNNLKSKLKGDVYSFNKCFKELESGNALTMTLHALNKKKELENVAMKIYFNNYKSWLKHFNRECPICLEPLTQEVFQCQNGHNVCSHCGTKINLCATCRFPMNRTKVNLREILLNVFRLCPNAREGCQQFFKTADTSNHATICRYKKVKCVKCKKMYAKHNINQHMDEKHKMYSNLQTFYSTIHVLRSDIFKRTDIVYITFNNEIFSFTETIIYREHDIAETVSYKVALMYSDDKNEAEKYRYEVQILDQKKSAIALQRVSGPCQLPTDNRDTSSVSLFENYLYKEPDTCYKFNSRCCILKAF